MVETTPSDKRQTCVLKSQPKGTPTEDNFELKTSEIPKPQQGEVLVKNLFISVDPYHRNLLSNAKPGDSIQAGSIGEVIESQSSRFQKGDLLLYYGSQSTHNVFPIDEKTEASQLFHPVKLPPLPPNVPISAVLGVLGMPGMTAYFALKNILKIKPGETVVVSAAAGAVGSAAGQFARHLYGAGKVIGTAGGQQKVKHAKEKYKFDEVLDYKQFDTKEKIEAEFKRVADKGVDAYFENTGGWVTHGLWTLYNKWARIAVCGQISIYNSAPPKVDDFLIQTVYRHILIEGFTVADYATYGSNGSIQQFYKDVVPLVEQGKVQYDQHVVDGFDNLPKAFLQLFSGGNIGKAVVKVADPSSNYTARRAADQSITSQLQECATDGVCADPSPTQNGTKAASASNPTFDRSFQVKTGSAGQGTYSKWEVDGREVEIDAAKAFGGQGKGVGPLPTILTSLASCQQITANIILNTDPTFTEKQKKIDSIDWKSVTGEFNSEVLEKGIESEEPSTWRRVVLKAAVKSNLDDSELKHLIRETERRCPLTALFVKAGAEVINEWTNE